MKPLSVARYKVFFAGLLLLFFLPSSAQQPVVNRLAAIDHASKGRLGVFAMLLETGDTISYRGSERFPMQSVYKMPINMVMLHAVDAQQFRLNQLITVQSTDILPLGHSPIRDSHPKGNVSLPLVELLRYNVMESDGTACDVLLRLLGGTKKVQQAVQRIGIKNICIATLEREQQVADPMVQYRNWAYPSALVQILDTLYRGHYLSAQSRSELMWELEQSGPGAKRIKGLLPKGTTVAHKTGTSGTEKNGLTRATNDAGLITLPNGKHIALAVFLSESMADQEAREATIAQAAKAVWDYWNEP
jgi:beta-lactamase class A